MLSDPSTCFPSRTSYEILCVADFYRVISLLKDLVAATSGLVKVSLTKSECMLSLEGPVSHVQTVKQLISDQLLPLAAQVRPLHPCFVRLLNGSLNAHVHRNLQDLGAKVFWFVDEGASPKGDNALQDVQFLAPNKEQLDIALGFSPFLSHFLPSKLLSFANLLIHKFSLSFDLNAWQIPHGSLTLHGFSFDMFIASPHLQVFLLLFVGAICNMIVSGQVSLPPDSREMMLNRESWSKFLDDLTSSFKDRFEIIPPGGNSFLMFFCLRVNIHNLHS